MDIKEVQKDSTQYIADVKLSSSEFEKLFLEELSKVARSAKINGFRTGKVPLSFIKKKYGDAIRTDVARDRMKTAIEDIKSKNSLENIMGEPAIENVKNEKGEDLKFTVKFNLLPNIELPDLGNISIEKPRLKVNKKDVDEHIKKLTQSKKNYENKPRAKAKDGDQVTIDAVGYVDDKAFDGGKLEDHKLILGSGAFIPGFEDQLIGSGVGDDIDVKVNFPKEYHAKELSDKPAIFKVKVKAVGRAKNVKVDDEFAKSFDCKDLDDLKQKVEDSISASYNSNIKIFMKMKLFDALDKVIKDKIDIPKHLLDSEIKSLEGEMSNIGEDDPDFAGKSDKEKADYLKNLAERRVRTGLFIAEYSRKNDIQVSEDDLRQAIVNHAKNYPGQEKQIIEAYRKNSASLQMLSGKTLEDKTVSYILDKKVSLVEKRYNKDELEKLLA